MIKNYKKTEISDNNRSEMTDKEFAISESENDPRFFSWLFDKEFEQDFDYCLSEEEKEEFNNWVDKL